MIAEIIDCFKQLENLTNILTKSIEETDLPYWMPEKTESTKCKKRIQSVLASFWYQDGQEGRETINDFGLVCINQYQFDLITKINNLKTEFKNHGKRLEASDKKAWLEVKGQLKSSIRDSSLSRLHLKQTWRHIPVLDQKPHKVSFNWYTSGRSIKRITVKECIDKLLDMGSEKKHIEVQIDNASKLSESTKLAQVQSQAPLMRANLVYRSDQDGRVISRKAMNAALPLFILSPELPEHNTPSIDPPTERTRAKRSDQLLEENPYLPSIRVHLYAQS